MERLTSTLRDSMSLMFISAHSRLRKSCALLHEPGSQEDCLRLVKRLRAPLLKELMDSANADFSAGNAAPAVAVSAVPNVASSGPIVEDPNRTVSKIACIAVIGERNQPLCLRVYTESLAGLPRRQGQSPELKMQEVIYNTLDVFEDLSETNARKETYVGCLATVGTIAMYGLMTSTKLKIVLGLRNEKGTEMHAKAALQRIHKYVIASFMNCFQSMDGPIHSQRFEASINALRISNEWKL